MSDVELNLSDLVNNFSPVCSDCDSAFELLDKFVAVVEEWHNENHSDTFAYCMSRPCRNILLEIRDL